MAEQRLIDANAIFPWYVETFKGKIAPNEVRFSMNDIACNLLNIPTIEERKTGKWLQDKHEIAGYGYFDCSECGADFYDTYNFCPNCGASMMEGEEHETD